MGGEILRYPQNGRVRQNPGRRNYYRTVAKLLTGGYTE